MWFKYLYPSYYPIDFQSYRGNTELTECIMYVSLINEIWAFLLDSKRISNNHVLKHSHALLSLKKYKEYNITHGDQLFKVDEG